MDGITNIICDIIGLESHPVAINRQTDLPDETVDLLMKICEECHTVPKDVWDENEPLVLDAPFESV
ncbi:MAG: hypothetical protein IKM91_05115 [Candidatus Methanomethylophilaceae archaeon]|nr:hypothetical protein [Candidatus Methanomethylophilaceae archaeon]MBR6870981.1 hypothetical protein [Candidatus Methanomethylophilaceae archaeon]